MKARIIRLLVTFSLLGICAANADEQEYTLLVYGDSLSAAYGMAEDQGWVTLLEQRLGEEDRPFQVVNGSVSGETTTGGLARLPAMLDSYAPDLVILELGANDGLRGLPLNHMEANLARMIEMIHAVDARIVLAGIQIPPNYGPRYTAPFFEIYGELAKEYNLALIPFLIDGIPQQPELMQRDGLHPRAEAQWMIVDNVWPVLEPILREMESSVAAAE